MDLTARYYSKDCRVCRIACALKEVFCKDVWLPTFFAAVMKLIKIYSVFSFRYYNWSSAAPLMLALQAFQKPLPKVGI